MGAARGMGLGLATDKGVCRPDVRTSRVRGLVGNVCAVRAGERRSSAWSSSGDQYALDRLQRATRNCCWDSPARRAWGSSEPDCTSRRPTDFSSKRSWRLPDVSS